MQDFVTLRQNLGFQERFLSSKIKLKERQRLDHQAPIYQHGAAFPGGGMTDDRKRIEGEACRDKKGN